MLIKKLQVNNSEFKELSQFICVVSLRFVKGEEYYVLPLMSANENYLELLVTDERVFKLAKVGTEALVKSFRFGFEFVISAKISEFRDGGRLLCLHFDEVLSMRNYRQFMRYDVNLAGEIFLKSSRTSFDIQIKDIGMEGVGFHSAFEDYQTHDDVVLFLSFTSGRKLKIPAIILRDVVEEKVFSGVYFKSMETEINTIYREELRDIERAHLSPLIAARNYLDKKERFPHTIAIYATNCDFTYYLIGLLLLLGFEQYEIYNDFRSFKNGMDSKKPALILSDLKKMDDDVMCVLKYARNQLFEVPLAVILPYQFGEKFSAYAQDVGDVYCLHQPLLIRELEACILELGILHSD